MSYKNNILTRSENQQKVKIIYYLVYIYLLLKPFYLFASGQIQISDIFIILAFGILFFMVKKNINIKKDVDKKIFLFEIFVFFVLLVSLIYSIIYFRTDFMKSALFYVFNFLGIYVLYYCMKDIKFISTVKKICVFNILLQLVLYILNIGKWYGIIRYMGTFNDPNQFAFFIFSSLIISYIINIILKNKNNWIIYIISSFLIFQSGSTGMLIGLGLFFIGIILNSCIKINFKKVTDFIIVSSIFLIPIILIILLNLNFNNIKLKIDNFNKNNPIINRFEEKLERADETNGNLLQERGYDKILNYPYKIIMGAGQGYNERYISYHKGEIHATFPSILFYYGIIPFIILVIWIWQNIRYSPISLKLTYFAVLIESFTLLNQRQILFWFIILLGSYYIKESD